VIEIPPNVATRFRELSRDPVLFCNTLLPDKPHNVCPVDRGEDCPQAGTPHDHGQVKFLREGWDFINCLLPGNRWGKSKVIAMKHIYCCMFKKGVRLTGDHTWLSMPYDTISAAMSFDQAELVFRAAETMLSTPAMAPFVKKIRATPFPMIEFWNGAKFHCRSAHDNGKYIDGHEYRLVTIDEAGWIDDLKGLINGVILMRLAGGGWLDLIGTPKGYGDLWWYANRGLRGVKGYYAQRGSVFDNPHLPPEDIKRRDELLAHADPRIRAQVIYGDFVSLEGMAFTQDQLDNLFDPDMPTHVDPIPGHRYVQAWDLGRKTDYTVGGTFDITGEPPFPLVDFVRLNRVPWETIYELIGEKRRQYNVQYPVIDATGPQGDVIEEELTKRGIPYEPYRISNGAIKVDLINTLQTALDEGREVIGERDEFDEAGNLRKTPDHEPPREGNWGLIRLPPIPQLTDEFGRYQLEDKKLQQDCVIMVALAAKAIVDGLMVGRPVLGGLFGQGEDDSLYALDMGRSSL
jgi:hypothetical protein